MLRRAAMGKSPALYRFVVPLKTGLGRDGEGQARVMTPRIVLAMQACLLPRFAPSEVSETFCQGGWSGSAEMSLGCCQRRLQSMQF